MPDEGKEDSIATAALRNRRDRPWPVIGLGFLAVAGAILLSRVTPVAERRLLVPLPDRGRRDPLDHAPARGRSRCRSLDRPHDRPWRRTGVLPGAAREARLPAPAAAREVARDHARDAHRPRAHRGRRLLRGVRRRPRQRRRRPRRRGHERRRTCRASYQLGIGTLDLDLRELKLPLGETHVDASVDVGDLHVIVPAGVALQAHGTAEIGEVDLPGDVGGRRPQRRERRRRDRAARARDRRAHRPRLGPDRARPYDEPGMLRSSFAPSSDDRVIAGVCAGIAQTLAVDVTLVRLVFALLALAGGAGIVLYLALWAYSRTPRRWVAAVLAARRRRPAAQRPRPLRPVGGRHRPDRGRARSGVAPGRQLPARRASFLRRHRAGCDRRRRAPVERRHHLDAARARRRRRRAAADRRPVGVAARDRPRRRAHRPDPQRRALRRRRARARLGAADAGADPAARQRAAPGRLAGAPAGARAPWLAVRRPADRRRERLARGGALGGRRRRRGASRRARRARERGRLPRRRAPSAPSCSPRARR